MLHPGKTQYIIQIVTGKQFLTSENSGKHRETHLIAGAVLLQTASTNTEKMQLFCNTHIYTVFHYTIMSISPTRHREIEE